MALTRRALVALAALAFGVPAAAQSALDMEIAQEFLTLELAGWRLPDPVEECLTGLRLRRLEPMAFGSEDLVDQPELVDPPGPFYRVLRVEPDPTNRRRRTVHFEWLLPPSSPGGDTVRPVRDSFSFSIGSDSASGGGRAMMQREPERMVIRRECFGG
jgi:hypothetical protein